MLAESATTFDAVLARLREVRPRPEIRLEEVPAPARLAPHSVALAAEVHADRQLGGSGGGAGGADDGDDEVGAGRFVLLYDPACPEPWGGAWRVVSFARAQLEPELSTDPALGGVGWSWLQDALDVAGADYVAAAGTVTRVVSERFGGLRGEPDTVEMEIRASWTPTNDAIETHLEAWLEVLATLSGLSPVPEGVAILPKRRA
nr:DUF3000 domain-containing protein [Arsenicicoccus piscis]